MSAQGKLDQSTGGVRRFVVRGKVLRHETKKSGWIFKSLSDVFTLELDSEDLETARERIGGFQLMNGGDERIPAEIRVTLPREEHKRNGFSIGSEVNVTFEYAGKVNQRHLGADALSILQLERRLDPGYRTPTGSV